MATTVEVMVEMIAEAGTPFIVGHPGGESVELMEAARQQGMASPMPGWTAAR
jgi:acetolactate synthase-1/2/3 large subunit